MSRAQPAAAVVGAGAVSAFGFGWRDLGRALADGRVQPRPCQALRIRPGALASEVPPIPPGEDAGDVKSRKLMSRAAHLSAVAMKAALRDAAWNEGLEAVGCYLGVGASAGHLEDLEAMLARSVEGGRVDLSRFTREGLAATNPLFAFHLLNNFVLCHGAIASGVGGPNAAFFSRGGGTVLALAEALFALREGACERALAGGSDSALHIATSIELLVGGHLDDTFVAGEGAAFLALAREAEHPLAILELPWTGRPPEVIARLPPAEIAVVVASARARPETLEATRRALPSSLVVDLGAALGDPLAAGPALGCAAALDLLLASDAGCALVLCAGVDGTAGAACLRRPDA